MKFDKYPDFGKAFSFPENADFNLVNGVHSVTQKMVAQFVDDYDDYIVSQIAKTARENGISELVVLNKAAIMDALKKQMPQKQRIDDNDWRCCPRCGETFFLTSAFNKRNKYCGNCGQALDWGD